MSQPVTTSERRTISDTIRGIALSGELLVRLIPVLLFVISCRPASDRVILNPSTDLTFPPEWEPHQAMWIDWTDFAFETRLDMIEALHENVHVNLLTFSDSLEALAWKMMKARNIDTSRVSVFTHRVPNYFIRDAGPKYLSNGEQYVLADFGWNCFGGADFDSLCLERGTIDNDLASAFGHAVRSTDIVIEGGALEVSSNEILAFSEMALHRNPERSLEEIERACLAMYGKKKMIWIGKKLLLEQPGRKIENYFGQGANGHIDGYMRFVNDSTIVVGVITDEDRNANPINQIDWERLQSNLRQVRSATNHEGKPFHVIEVPMPDVTPYCSREVLSDSDTHRHPGLYAGLSSGDTIIQVPVMSYLNFTISNDVVLIPRYWREGIPEKERAKDDLFFDLITKLFPGRVIIQINALPLNWNGGGIHCATQQVPRLK
jgi:Peptidylarginine deiminase and related enzymes